MHRAGPRPPLWYQVLAALAGAAVAYWLWSHPAPAPHDSIRQAPELQYAFFGWFVVVVQAIWTGVQAAAHVTLAVLSWSVQVLWTFARAVGNLAREIGSEAIKAFRASWKFFRAVYDEVLKPAWLKFWKFIDWARRSLEDLFKPVFKFLRFIRKELLKFYEKWVRPALDTIELARHVLKVFKKLGVEWAGKLDAKLAGVEDWIQDRFQYIYGKVNEVINMVNRVVTADGLFQRLALVRSITRDFAYIQDEWAKLVKKPKTEEELAAARKRKYFAEDPKVYGVELVKLYSGTESEYSGIVGELVPEWRKAAGIGRPSV